MKPPVDQLLLAQHIKRIVDHSGYTIPKLCHEMDMSETALLMWRNGKTIIPYDGIQKLAEVMNMRLSDKMLLLSLAHQAVLARWKSAEKRPK